MCLIARDFIYLSILLVFVGILVTESLAIKFNFMHTHFLVSASASAKRFFI